MIIFFSIIIMLGLLGFSIDLVGQEKENVTIAKKTILLDTDVFSGDEIKDSIAQDTNGFNEVIVRQGDSLSLLLSEHGIASTTIYKLTKSRYGRQLKSLRVGDRLSILTQYDRLEQLIYQPSNLEAYHYIASQHGFNSVHRQYDVETYLQLLNFVIKDSLFESAINAGLSNRMIIELAGIYAWDIDFAVDLRNGDRFSLIYEELVHQGEKIGEGDIVATEFINRGKRYQAVLFEESNGSKRYFNTEGKSMERAFLRTPLDIFRISSHFNPHRKHPVLNTIRAHRGTDYAAPRGTAIKATGSGVIKFIGRDGGYGNVIKIAHGSNRETRYAHIDRFHKRLKKGSKVRQGQVIGYVGKTGLATGYHLHYEYLVNGIYRNPVRVKFPKASPVSKSDKKRFNQESQQLLAVLNNFNQYFASR